MPAALIVGGTGFIGRHTTRELLDHGYEVTVCSRGAVDRPALQHKALSYVEVDRTDTAAFDSVVADVAPHIVIDCAVFHPETAEHAIEIFGGVDAYVYVSTGGVYARDDIPKRESETPLHSFTAADAADDSMETYGPRKAECDRIVRDAVEQGVPGMSVRSTMVYGPKTTVPGESPVEGSVSWAADFPGIQNHHEYWIDRINRYDRVVVPGDGTAIWHRAYVEDVASALRIVAEDGVPGEAYNVADRRVLTVDDVIELIAETLDTTVEITHASRRELAEVDLTPDDFVLYHHYGHNYPHVLATCKLTALGWRSTPPAVAMERTVEEAVASDRDGRMFDPGRAAEERLLATLTE